MRAGVSARLAARRPRTQRLVVFVSDRQGWREAKLAYGLLQNGWQVVLLHGTREFLDASKYCVETRLYESPAEALLLASRYSPVAYHVFSSWGFDTAAMFIRHPPGKVVFDDYDLFAGMVKEDFAKKHYPGHMELERFCLENADGLCCRSPETQYAKRYMGYKYSGKRIFFADYCWNTVQSTVKKRLNGDFAIGIVGNLYIDEKRDINHPSNYHLKLALAFAEHGIRTHLFIVCLTKDLDLFLQKTLTGNPYVHYDYVPPDQLVHRLHSQCHAGLVCAPPGVTSSHEDAYCTIKRKYGASNKVFDFMDAGIPIIMDTESEFLYRFVRRYHKVFDFNTFISNLDGFPSMILEALARNGDQFTRAKTTLSVGHQAVRLIQFYEKLQQNQLPKNPISGQ